MFAVICDVRALLKVLRYVCCLVCSLACRFDAATAAAVPFHPRFVKYVANFGVLRFMAWMEANSNQVSGCMHQRHLLQHS
jgi:hypothetical protein